MYIKVFKYRKRIFKETYVNIVDYFHEILEYRKLITRKIFLLCTCNITDILICMIFKYRK